MRGVLHGIRLSMIVLYAACAYASTMTDWKPIAKRVSESIVSVQSNEGACTGFVINSAVKGDLDHVLTAAHCAGTEIFADNAVAKVIWKDMKHDLMILEVADTGRPALRLAKSNPEIGEEVASYGYGMALARPMFRTAHVSDDAAEVPGAEGGPFLMIDAAFVAGQSGGPCVNAAGEIALIVQQGTDKLGIGVGAERIRSRAGKYFEKEKP